LLGKNPACRRAIRNPRSDSSASATKASSSVAVPASARSSAAPPCATERPCATTTMSSHTCSTSCMMCVENRMQRPSSRSCASSLRSARVDITSSPLVGSSRIRCCGSWISARASATFIRSPLENPAVGRSSNACMSSTSAKRCNLASHTAAGMPRNLA